jgi:hypothetical protein
MTPHQRRTNAYIQRMIDDMRIRNFAEATINAYSLHVDKFCMHFGQPAEALTLDHIRDYQIFLVKEKKVSWSSFNQAVCALSTEIGQTEVSYWKKRSKPYWYNELLFVSMYRIDRSPFP